MGAANAISSRRGDFGARGPSVEQRVEGIKAGLPGCPPARVVRGAGRGKGPPRGGRAGAGRWRANRFHHRRRSIHVSPSSETRTSKRLRSRLNGRSGCIQTRRASIRRSPRAPGRRLWHPADRVQGDPEPNLAAVRGEIGTEPEGAPVGFQAGVARRQCSRAAGPVRARPCDDDLRLVGHVPPVVSSPRPRRRSGGCRTRCGGLSSDAVPRRYSCFQGRAIRRPRDRRQSSFMASMLPNSTRARRAASSGGAPVRTKSSVWASR